MKKAGICAAVLVFISIYAMVQTRKRVPVIYHMLDIEMGMSRQEVADLLKKPLQGEKDILSYRLFVMPFKPRLYVLFRDNKVIRVYVQ